MPTREPARQRAGHGSSWRNSEATGLGWRAEGRKPPGDSAGKLQLSSRNSALHKSMLLVTTLARFSASRSTLRALASVARVTVGFFFTVMAWPPLGRFAGIARRRIRTLRNT